MILPHVSTLNKFSHRSGGWQGAGGNWLPITGKAGGYDMMDDHVAVRGFGLDVQVATRGTMKYSDCARRNGMSYNPVLFIHLKRTHTENRYIHFAYKEKYTLQMRSATMIWWDRSGKWR